MVKTGNWTIAELMKYLVSVRSTLEDAEIERLRGTAAFPKEPGSEPENSMRKKVSRHLACHLYEPSAIFRKLCLPVLDWGKKQDWDESSEEGQQRQYSGTGF